MAYLALVARAETPSKPQGYDPTLVKIYVAFQFLGQFGLLATVLTITFSKSVSRHITFVNFCITWIISTICYLFLTYGGQQMGPAPSFGLCLAQAALIYAAPPMTAVSTAVLVAQMWFATKLTAEREKELWQRIRDIAFLAVPYIVFLCFIIGAGATGGANPTAVERSRTSMYCVIRKSGPGNGSAAFTILFIVVALVFEGLILRHVWQNWKEIRAEDGEFPLNFLVRTSIFAVLVVFCVGIGIVFLVGSGSAAPNLFLAFLPLAAFVIFGTQSDIVAVWKFWESDAFKERFGSFSSSSEPKGKEKEGAP